MAAALDTLGLPAHAVDWPVALDTEASGLFVDDGARVSVVSCAWRQDGEIQSRVWAFDQGDDTWLGPKQGIPPKYPGPSLFDQESPNLGLVEWQALGEWLRRQALIYHNSKYDQHIFRVGLRGRPDTGIYLGRSYHWDTLVVAPLLWPNEPNGLKPIAQRLWGEQERQAEVEMRGWLQRYCGKRENYRYDLAPWSIMEPYARHDPVLTLRLYELQRDAVACREVDPVLVQREINLAQVLYRMEARGVGFDVASAKAAHESLRLRIANAHDALRSATGLEVHTEAEMRRYWFTRLAIPPVARTDAGQPSVAAAVIRTLAERGVQGAKEYQTLTKLETAEAMWYGNWYRLVGDDGRIRTSYHQTKTQDDRRGGDRGTVSGRLAVERWQAQAIPHDYQLPEGLPTVRSFIVPKPGYVLVECDMNQAEMRMAAGLTGCQAMIEGFLRGDDAHSMTARHTFQIDESSPNWKYLRAVAKRLNFGLIYGAGEATIRDQIILFTGTEPDPAEVHEWMVEFKHAFPELDRGSRAAIAFADARGFVEMPGGRRRYFRFGEPTHKAFNARIQGGVSQCMAIAMISIEEQMPGYQLLQTHDSILFEVPHDDEGRAVVRAGMALMQEAFESQVAAPFKVDAKVWH